MVDNSSLAKPEAAAMQPATQPLGKDPGTWSHIQSFSHGIFDSFYNTFRLIGYLASAYYSEALRALTENFSKRGIADQHIHPRLLVPDWKSKSRMVVNALETAIFIIPSIVMFYRDRNEFRRDIGDLVAAERGKDKNTLGIKDFLASQNPLVQTTMNRFKGLYALRFFQPLSFLWGLKLGITATFVEIVGERAAYFEKNSYDRLQIMMKEIDGNQKGAWSHDVLVAQLIEIIQRNRMEHNVPSLSSRDVNIYMPLLQQTADKMLAKQWNFSDMLHVIGQVIKEPALPEKVWQAYTVIEQKCGRAASIPSESAPALMEAPEISAKKPYMNEALARIPSSFVESSAARPAIPGGII